MTSLQQKPPIWMGGFGFENKSRLAEFCEAIQALHLRKSSPVPRKFIEDLILQSRHYGHAKVQQAILAGNVAEFRVECRDGGLGFVATLKDGGRMPFGYRNAINPPTSEDLLKGVCRQSVSPDIADWKDKWLARHGDGDSIICPVSGVKTLIKACHVDHFEPTFQEIFERFRGQALSGIDIDSLIFEDTNIPAITLIAEPDNWIAEEFRRFHNAATELHNVATPHLRLISASANLGRKRK